MVLLADCHQSVPTQIHMRSSSARSTYSHIAKRPLAARVGDTEGFIPASRIGIPVGRRKRGHTGGGGRGVDDRSVLGGSQAGPKRERKRKH